jgi:CBS domain-containing protein
MSVSESPDPGDSADPSGRVTVGDLMRSPTTTVEPDAHVASAAYLMKRAGDSALVVTSDDARRVPIAMITDADVSQAVADGRDLDDTRINQLRLTRPVAVDPGTSVAEAAEEMLRSSLQHLPVVDDGRLVGVVDISSVCRVLLRQQRTA